MIVDRPARRRWVIATLVGVPALVLVVSLAQAPSDKRTIHQEGGGVLSASSGVGGVSIYPAPRAPWTASFGTFILCVRKKGERARIEAVRSTVYKQPLKVRHLLRVVPPKPERPGGFSWVDYYSELAAFPGSGKKPYGGTLHGVEGAVISQPCAEVRHTRDNGFSDLLTELTVDEGGSMVKRTEIDYASNGRRYTLVVRWEMTACGNAMPREHCSGP